MKKLPPEYYQDLEEIQAIDFALVELTLYLDTHPNDQQAMQQFNEYAQQAMQLKRNFETKMGRSSNMETAIPTESGAGEQALGHGKYKQIKAGTICGCMKRNCSIQ